ncbi:Two-component response regulator Orr4 [Orobanche hederae]
MDLDIPAASHDYKCTSDEEKHIFHVLAVDDSNIDRKLLEKLLTLSSYQVTCVDSGDKALEYLGLLEKIIKENKYEISSSSPTTVSCESSSKSSQQQVAKCVNLIMTDYSMPGISGYDLLKRIKDSYWKDIPVVVMSSENVPSRINMCLEGGAEEFLLKPVKLSDVKKIHSHLYKCTITAYPRDRDDQTTSVDEYSSVCSNDKATTNVIINRDDDSIENDENCSNANNRETNLATSSDSSNIRPLSRNCLLPRY